MFISEITYAPYFRSRPFLWVRNGAVILLLAIAALVVLPPNPALAFWSVAMPGWEAETDTLAQHVELHLADESNNVSQDYFDSVESSVDSQIEFNAHYRESELSLTQDEKSLFAKYTNNEDLFNEPLRGRGAFSGAIEISEQDVAQLDAALARSGSYVGIAYRVQKIDPEYIEGLQVDGLYTDTAFSSASIHFRAAYNNAGEDMSQTDRPKVIFKRILRTGKVMSDFPDGAVSNDSQVVSRPKTVFRVRGIAKIQSENMGEVTVVVEEEVGEGGLAKADDAFVRRGVKLYSGKNYRPSLGGAQSKYAYNEAYNKDGTSKAGSGGCTRS